MPLQFNTLLAYLSHHFILYTLLIVILWVGEKFCASIHRLSSSLWMLVQTTSLLGPCGWLVEWSLTALHWQRILTLLKSSQ